MDKHKKWNLWDFTESHLPTWWSGAYQLYCSQPAGGYLCVGSCVYLASWPKDLSKESTPLCLSMWRHGKVRAGNWVPPWDRERGRNRWQEALVVASLSRCVFSTIRICLWVRWTVLTLKQKGCWHHISCIDLLVSVQAHRWNPSSLTVCSEFGLWCVHSYLTHCWLCWPPWGLVAELHHPYWLGLFEN